MSNIKISKRITLLFRAIPKTAVILFCFTVVGMNVLAQYQLVSLPYLAINAGICVSWLSFLILDIVTKYFGAKAANALSILAVVVNLLVGSVFFTLSILLNKPNYDVFAFSAWSILLASTIAFVISALTNNYVNVFVGKRTKHDPNGKLSFTIRSYASTFLGQIVDNFIFVFLAFYLLPYLPNAIQVRWTIWQCIGASFFGAILELLSEVVFVPFGYSVVKRWEKKKLGLDYLKTTYELEKMPAYQIGELVNNGTFTPLEVVKYFEDRIDKYNKKVNAITYTKFAEAEKEAERIQKLLDDKKEVGPFAGVPFGLKDFLDSKKGWSNSCGGIPSFDRIDQSDSSFTKAMEKLGGIAICKCNAPTYGFRGTCDNLRYGPSKNPYNLKYNSGGSSGGSASAVSYGLLPIAEGGDAGGSIRIPASWTNTFGCKASSGTVPCPTIPGIDPYSFPFCMNGGLTKSVKDAAILLTAMQSYDPKDVFSQKKKKIDYVESITKPIKDLKIAYTDDFGIFPVEEQIKKKVYQRAKSLTKLGARVERVRFAIPYTQNQLSELWCLAISMENVLEYQEYQKQGIDLSNKLPKQVLYWNERALKEKGLLEEYRKAKSAIQAEFERIFKDYDAIISPVTGCLAPLNQSDGDTTGPNVIDGKEVDPLIGFALTYLVNYIGNPACSYPSGFGKHHLPIGLQIIGRYMEDETVLQIAGNLERIHPIIK